MALTEEQQELIHRLTGEHANVLGGLGNPPQQWTFGLPNRSAFDPGQPA